MSQRSRRVHVVYDASPHLAAAPCVVLEAGANSWSPVWGAVAARVARSARVLRYDRPGFGFSDPAPARSVGAVADDLAATLAAAGARPPYVLVAHSLGALYINVLAQRLRARDVVGVVYVDAASPEAVRLLDGVVPSGTPPAWLARALGALGLLRVLAPLALRPYAAAFRGELRREARATWARGDWLLAYTAEWAAAMRCAKPGRAAEPRAAEPRAAEPRAAEPRSAEPRAAEPLAFPPGWLGSIPIAVLVPDVYQRTEGKAYIGGLQSEVARYSSDAAVIAVHHCGHFVQLERPDVVADAICGVLVRAQARGLGLQDAGDGDPN